MAKSKCKEVLELLEWTGRTDGVPSCPICHGIKDTPAGRTHFPPTAIGHRPACVLAGILGPDVVHRIPVKPA